jgi:hypothetical protein
MKARTVFILITAFAGLVLLSFTGWAVVPRDTARPTHSAQLAAQALPFSFDEVVGYFRYVFGNPTFKVDDGFFVFVDSNNPDESLIIAVSSVEQKVSILFLATGDFGFSYIRDFFEAPFFREAETERFYALLAAGLGTRSAEFGRFSTDTAIIEMRGWIILQMEFRPSQSFRG